MSKGQVIWALRAGEALDCVGITLTDRYIKIQTNNNPPRFEVYDRKLNEFVPWDREINILERIR